jgi:hypothetical protein
MAWSGRLARLGLQPASLVLDLDRDLGERLGVLAVVVSAEQQLTGSGQDYPYICGRPASVAQI